LIESYGFGSFSVKDGRDEMTAIMEEELGPGVYIFFDLEIVF
jgi:hypothetical protein